MTQTNKLFTKPFCSFSKNTDYVCQLFLKMGIDIWLSLENRNVEYHFQVWPIKKTFIHNLLCLSPFLQLDVDWTWQLFKPCVQARGLTRIQKTWILSQNWEICLLIRNSQVTFRLMRNIDYYFWAILHFRLVFNRSYHCHKKYTTFFF